MLKQITYKLIIHSTFLAAKNTVPLVEWKNLTTKLILHHILSL